MDESEPEDKPVQAQAWLSLARAKEHQALSSEAVSFVIMNPFDPGADRLAA